jgi:hypothetical protein
MDERLRADLGKMPDSMVAEKHGLEKRQVCTLRQKAGISAFNGYLMFQEGGSCRSLLEAKYDAYLHWRGVLHQHGVRIPNLPYIADFLIEDSLYLEVVGMRRFAKYEEKFQRKLEAYRDEGLACLFLLPEDVEKAFGGCPLEIKVCPDRVCKECLAASIKLINGLCSRCSRRKWGRDNGSECICEGCGEGFVLPAGSTGSGRFCGYDCYWKSLEADWPSWEWIDEQLESKSIRQLAIEMGVKYTSLYMRIRRRRERASAA